VTGASGARFEILKWSDDPRVVRRLHAQYHWLKDRDYPSLVRVGVWRDRHDGRAGYMMELLEPGLVIGAFPRDAAQRVVDALAPVWAEPPLRPGPWVPRLDHLPPELTPWWAELTVAPHHYCGTHGDPTLENMMQRGPQTVMIDPVPDIVLDGKVPAIRALDYGKILQSGLGYEAIRRGYRSRWALDQPIFAVVRDAARDDDEWRQACWCCALHVAKFLPYQPDDLRAWWTAEWPGIVRALREVSR